jgi:hypothetical protein
MTLCVVYTVHMETMSADFLIEPQNQGRWFGLKTGGDGFLWFGLKIGGDGFLRFGIKTGDDDFSRFSLKIGVGFLG